MIMLLRGWSQSSVAAEATFVIPFQLLTKTKALSSSTSRRYSMVGSALAIASASAVLANAAATSSSSISSSSSKCESDGRNNVMETKEVSPWYQDPTIIAISTPLLMETSTPLSTKSVGIIHTTAQHEYIGNVNNIPHPPTLLYPMPTRTWWTLRWWWKDDDGSSTRSQLNYCSLWWKRVGQSFFVITRGIEIVVRLSPLIILTPTAMIVSHVDAMWRRFFWYKKWKPSNQYGLPLTTSPLVLQKMGDLQAHDDSDDHDIYTTQFQEEINNTHHYNYQTTTTSSWASDIAWSYTLHTLQCLGPAFVKLGQWAATRRDLFPVHVCNRFAELQDTARVHDWKYTHQALVDAFGTDYEQRGLVVGSNANSNSSSSNEDLDEEMNVNTSGSILGSGCAAQVHIGTLHNKTVAVKVLHPHTRSSIQRDLALMQHVADFIDHCIPLNVVKMLSLPRAVSNFANIMTGQVDLRVEGENLRVFRDNFGCTDHHDHRTHNNPIHQTITFPYPEMEWVSEHVLVEEYAGVDAFPISKYLHDTSSDGLKTRKELAGILLRAFLKMVFIDNFIHADLHPGNVLVRAVPMKSNPKKVKYNIVFIDAGIATSLQPNDRKNLHDLFKAIVLNDGYTAGQLMVERARYERCSSIPGGTHAFATGVAEIVSEFHDRRKQGLTLGAVRVGALLGRVLDLCRRYQVEIDPAMSSVVVSMLVLEGLGRSLDPDLNLMKAAMPFLIGKV